MLTFSCCLCLRHRAHQHAAPGIAATLPSYRRRPYSSTNISTRSCCAHKMAYGRPTRSASCSTGWQHRENLRARAFVERAFVAGACIAGSLSHNDCAQLFSTNVASKSTITRTIQRFNERAVKLKTTMINPCCFKFPSNRGPARLLGDEQRARVVAITIASQQSREKESWQATKDRDFVNAGLPNFSVSLHENIMYDAGYARRRPGWKLTLSPEQKKERHE
jgi:hypothetical protein